MLIAYRYIVALFLKKPVGRFMAVLSIWYGWNCLFKLFPLVLHTWF